MHTVPLSLLLLLVVLSSALDINEGDFPSLLPVPDQPAQPTQHHQLSKRQSPLCLFFFLQEPPRSVQCLPRRDILSLNCTLLVGQITRRMTLEIGWFFSLDGIEAQLVQVSQFDVRNTFVAYQNMLEVLDPLPGAYFCSAQIAGQIFDSSVLRVENQVLRRVCGPGQLPTLLQPSTPRCATQGVRINPNTLVLRTVISTTNTINLGGGGGAAIPTPTYDTNLLRTMELPEDIIIATPSVTPSVTPPVTPSATPSATPSGPIPVAQQSPAVAIGVGVGIAGLLVLVALILALILGTVCFVKKRDRNQLIPRRGARTSIFERFSIQLPNREPLLPPPDRPPPVLNGNQHYAVPTSPQPYEQPHSSMPRYTGGLTVNNPLTIEKEGKFPNVLPQPVPSPTNSWGSKTGTYYSRPRFYKTGRLSSTSTHIYGELPNKNAVEAESDSMYISPRQLEPFEPENSPQVTEKELMLGNIEKSAESCMSEETIPSGSEEGSLSDEFDNYPAGGKEEKEEEVGETGESGDYSLDEPSSWINKSPATGQDNPFTDLDPAYVNTTQHEAALEESQLPGFGTDEVKYVNARAAASAAMATIKALSIKSAPSLAKKKKKREVRRNKSTPSSAQQPDQERDQEKDRYIGLTLETANYTSVYTSTYRNRPKSPADREGN